MRAFAHLLLLSFVMCGSMAAQETRASPSPPRGDTLLAVPDEFNEPQNENLLDPISTESDNSELLDNLIYLQEHPLDLNKATAGELQTIPGITPAEAEMIVAFRSAIHGFTSVKQIAAMDENGNELLRKVEPYLSVVDRSKAVRLVAQAMRDLQPRRGFQDSSFLGSSLRVYNRLSLKGADNLDAQVLFKKDPGERVADGFASGYVHAKDLGFLSHAIVGDYVVEAGQGLVFWRGTAFGKGGESIYLTKRTGRGPQPYHATDEFNFLRGAALSANLETGIGDVCVSAFSSRRLLSATALSSDSVTSLYTGGLFRTETEVTKRNAMSERLTGGHIRFFPSDRVSFGASYSAAKFDKTLVPSRLFEFSGSSSNVVGVDGELRWRGVTAFGEAARSGDAAAAVILGAILNVKTGVDVAIVYRDYSPRFTNLHANGFGEGSDTKNERGFYLGTRVQVSRSLRLSGYIDLFTHPWRTFDNPLPSSGHDILVQADGQLSNRLGLSLRYSMKSTETVESALDAVQRQISVLCDRAQQKARITATLDVSPRVAIRTRVEATDVGYSVVGRRERGLLLYQDIRYTPSSHLTIGARLVFFDTDSYDSRVYEYESDLRGVFSNPGLFGKGRRWYLLVRFRPTDFLHFSAKYSETQKEGVTSMGSGVSEILGDVDNRVAVQLEIAL